MEWTVNQNKPILICLSETHVTKDLTTNEIDIEGYNTLCNYSSSKHTGGTIIYIKKGYRFKEISNIEYDKNLWIAGIEVNIQKQKYYIYSLYHSPSASTSKFLEKLDELLENIGQDAVFIILGDFNIDLQSDSFYANKLINLINSHGVYQLIEKCTRITRTSATKIDLLITNQKDLTHDVHIKPKITDHTMISVDLNNKHIAVTEKKVYRNYKIMDNTGFQLRLMEMEWRTNSKDVNLQAVCLTDNLQSALNEFAPQKTILAGEKWGNKKWWTKEIKNEMWLRDNLYKRAVITKTEGDWQNFRQQRNLVVALIRNTKNIYYNEKIDDVKDNPNEMWKTLKTLIGNKQIEVQKNQIKFDNKMIKGDEICENFNRFFIESIENIVKNFTPHKTHIELVQPIQIDTKMEHFNKLTMSELRKIVKKMTNKESNTDGITVNIVKLAFETIGDKILNLVNSSLQYGIFPNEWKKSLVIPIEKKVGTIKCEEFRPINMVPPYEKLLELCVNDQIVKYIEDNHILTEYQAGFRKKNSCESALQTVLFNWKNALEDGKVIGVVFLDFKRAFETINRQLLLCKMGKYGMGHKILQWFESYLNDRTQVTKYKNCFSTEIKSKWGVPQGTVLGPTLFILYINDIVNSVKNCKIQLFADDTVMYVTGDDTEKIIETLNGELNNVVDWLNNNSLSLNISKTKVMFIRKRKCAIDLGGLSDIEINNEVIERVDNFKYLGCIIDKDLSFSEHFKYITNKIAKKVNFLGRISEDLSSWAKQTIYNTIIAPHFYYCSTLLFLMNKTEINLLQKKQNKALRIILGCNRYSRISIMLSSLNLLGVNQLVTYNTMIFIYKMLNKLLPKHLIENCKFVKDIHEHNTRSRENFYINTVSSGLSQNSLFFKGLIEYNNLPNNVKSSSSLISFKKLCMKYVKENIAI